MTRYSTRFLTPPQEEDFYPYRRVWRSLQVEIGGLLLVVVVAFIAFRFVGLRLPQAVERPAGVALALLPLGLWLVASWFPERFAAEPRSRLFVVMLIGALAANAVGLPLINDFFQVDRWLPLSNALTRILGYSFTVGVVENLLKYLIVYYLVWREDFHTRLDGVAYCLACAVGYATVINLDYVFSNRAMLDVIAMRIFDVTCIQFMTAILVGYGLGEMRFGRPTPLLMALSLALAATMTGMAIAVRAGLVNANLTLETSDTSPLLGVGLSLALVFGIAVVVAFIIENTERQEREAAAERD